MTKLFLSSLTILPAHEDAFVELAGKPVQEIKFALIENAADVESGDKQWVIEFRESILEIGMDVEIINLNAFVDTDFDVKRYMDDFDVIWCGGGNTFYLRSLLERTGVDQVIQKHVKKGKIYGGASAGAIVAGPTLKYVEMCDDISKVQEPIVEGLGLTDVVVLPHLENPDFDKKIRAMQSLLEKDGYETISINDKQAVVINEKSTEIIG